MRIQQAQLLDDEIIWHRQRDCWNQAACCNEEEGWRSSRKTQPSISVGSQAAKQPVDEHDGGGNNQAVEDRLWNLAHLLRDHRAGLSGCLIGLRNLSGEDVVVVIGCHSVLEPVRWE